MNISSGILKAVIRRMFGPKGEGVTL